MEKHENMKGDLKSLSNSKEQIRNINMTETCHQTKANCISDWHTVILNMMTVEMEAPPPS